MSVLSCENLHRYYQSAGQQIKVLKGVDLQINPSEVIAILGPSGSGKSTLLHLLAGLDSPTSGSIHWQDFAVHNANQHTRAKKRANYVGLVFQQHYLLEDLTVLENVTLAGRIQGHINKDRANELLESVGLMNRAHFLPKKLSGGERQRVAVARALYLRPALILADEPTGSLDRVSARGVYALLVDLAKQDGSAVILVTHDEGLVDSVDKRYELLDGRLLIKPAPVQRI